MSNKSKFLLESHTEPLAKHKMLHFFIEIFRKILASPSVYSHLLKEVNYSTTCRDIDESILPLNKGRIHP